MKVPSEVREKCEITLLASTNLVMSILRINNITRVLLENKNRELLKEINYEIILILTKRTMQQRKAGCRNIVSVKLKQLNTSASI